MPGSKVEYTSVMRRDSTAFSRKKKLQNLLENIKELTTYDNKSIN